MPKSIRILTEIGKDKSVQVDLNQEFDHLQILSLQFTQSELYQRRCSDYGVVVGRVNVNNGYGLPNAKVSVFIPLTDEDSEDPIISQLYPYKSLNDTNDEGYQYNLLPQIPSYSNHVPTGSFPTKEQIMKDPGWKMVFDKYYKFSVTTNQSGDFMIFGLPLGEHKLVMNIDLSDIGEFSLTPQDMIRMGLATEAEVDGIRFKSSENFKILPQIVTIVKDVTILPLWGDEDICQSSINRTDFDLSADSGKNIVIQPTAIFMGSMVSTLDRYAVSRYKGGNDFCRIKLKTGELCKMIAGPGEILAIRHTIEQDSQGRPILEQYLMESNGKVIDGDGTWLVEIPMNLNYIVTDQFGNQVPSLDASAGIPTTARYRFKIKWQQPDNFDQDVKRGYFLVPNIKEWWDTASNDPNLQASPPSPTSLFTKSYSFSLDWDDYGDSTADGQQMILEAITCEDRFYEFYYNKVYTVSQLIDQYRGGKLNRRYNSIKNILDEECESDTLKFPTNDAQWRPDFIYLVFSIFLRVLTPIFIILLVVLHIIGFLLWFLAPILTIVMCIVYVVVFIICKIINSIRRLFGGDPPPCDNPGSQCSATKRAFDKMINDLKNFPLANLTYPDCEMCNCTVEKSEAGSSGVGIETEQFLNTQSFSQLSDWTSMYTYDRTIDTASDFVRYGNQINDKYRAFTNNYSPDSYIFVPSIYEELQALSSFPFCLASVMGGKFPKETTGDTLTLDAFCPIFEGNPYNYGDRSFIRLYFSSNLPIAGRLNLFNTKQKFFNGQVGSLENPGTTGPIVPGVINYGTFSGPNQGPNQIKVSFNYTANTGSFHYDNVFVISCDEGSTGEFVTGRIVTFQDILQSTDLNALSASTNNDDGIPSITGTTRMPLSINNTYTYNVNYANPNSSTSGIAELSTSYNLICDPEDVKYHRWPIDIEYFQVITAMTMSTYDSLCTIDYTLNEFCYPPERVFSGNISLGAASPYRNTMRNSLHNRFVFNYNLIREYGKWNIERPDFWRWDFNAFDSATPLWNSSCGCNATPPGCVRRDPWVFCTVQNTPKNLFWEIQSPIEGSTAGKRQVLVFLVRGVDPYSTRNENSYDLSPLFGKGFGSGPIVTGKYKLNIPIQKGDKLARHNVITANYGSGSKDPETINSDVGLYYQSFIYTPGNDFSGFTSTMHRFYSSMDRKIVNNNVPLGENGNWVGGSPSAGAGFESAQVSGGILKIWAPRNVGSDPNAWFGGETNAQTIKGIGANPEVFVPRKNDWCANLFAATFDWHAGNAVPPPGWDYAMNSNNLQPSCVDQQNSSGLIASPQQPCVNGCNQTNFNQYESSFTFVGKFAWHGNLKWGLAQGCANNYVDCKYFLFLGSYQPDGYWLPRMNNLMNGQTPNLTGYRLNRGYYADEVVEGGEVYALRMLSQANGNTQININGIQYQNNFWVDGGQWDRFSEGWGCGHTHGLVNRYAPFFHTTSIWNNNPVRPQMRLFASSYYLPWPSTAGGVPNNPYNPGVLLINNPTVTMSTPLTFVTTSIGKTYTIMRSDRLPTSSRTFELRNYNQNGSVVGGTTYGLVPLSYVLHNNPNFTIYTFDDDAVSLSSPPIATGQNFPSDTSITADTANAFLNVINTTNECNQMLPLSCYYNQTISAGGGAINYDTIIADPNLAWREGTCTSQSILGLGSRKIFDVETGCYNLASRFILSLKIDIELLLEWKSRLDITFGACRNVFSHIFTNQWINGTLYAYSFKNEKIIQNRNNEITGYRYCYDTLFLHPITNSFFYRSTAWYNGKFVGKSNPNASDGGNKKYLNNPTTIMDLGPKTDYLQQIVLNDNFDGYIMKDLRDSTFGDTSDILNFFILSRLLNTSYFQMLVGVKGAGILGYFSRVKRTFVVQPVKQKNFVDADFAQAISINSELGIDAFEVAAYPFADTMYYHGGSDSDETVIGVFYASDQRVRDFLTPRRTIFNSLTTQASWPNSFGIIPQTKTQYVPFYNWKLSINTSNPDIFGTQQNDWATGDITGYYYQSLDRLDYTQVSNYMSPVTLPAAGPPPLSRDFRGYIFNYNRIWDLYDPDITDTNPYANGDYINNGNQIPREVITHGAPFHFYFGLKKGKTALDRFLTKYTQDTDLI